MKVIFGIAILTAKDIDALNARIDAVERATGRNEYRIAKLGGSLQILPLSSLRLWTSSAGIFR